MEQSVTWGEGRGGGVKFPKKMGYVVYGHFFFLLKKLFFTLKEQFSYKQIFNGSVVSAKYVFNLEPKVNSVLFNKYFRKKGLKLEVQYLTGLFCYKS